MFRRELIAAIALLLTSLTSIGFAGKYQIVAAEGPNVVISTPADQQLSLGDQFLILRGSGNGEDILAIGILDKFQGKFCRIRITETLLSHAPQKGDFVALRDEKSFYSAPTFEETYQPLAQQQTYEQPRQASISGKEKTVQINIFSGVGQSDFVGSELYPNQDIFVTDQSFFTPIGLQVLYAMGRFRVGAEASYAAAPFAFQEYDATTGEEIYTDELSQLQIGAVVRFDLLQGAAKPYVRAGGGIYNGDFTRKFNSEYSGLDPDIAPEALADQALATYKTSLGYNAGAGVSYRAWFIEGVYHGVQRKPETSAPADETADENAVALPTFNANHWSVHAGLQLSF